MSDHRLADRTLVSPVVSVKLDKLYALRLTQLPLLNVAISRLVVCIFVPVQPVVLESDILARHPNVELLSFEHLSVVVDDVEAQRRHEVTHFHLTDGRGVGKALLTTRTTFNALQIHLNESVAGDALQLEHLALALLVIVII